MNDRGALGVARLQESVESTFALLARQFMISTSGGRASVTCGKRHLIERRPDIEARSSTDDGHRTFSDEAIELCTRRALVQGGRVGYRRLRNINKKKRRVALLGTHLGGTDIHPPIHLHGIGRNNHGMEPVREGISHSTLPHRGGPNDGDNRGHRASPTMEPARYQVRAVSTSTSTIRPTRSAGSIPSGTGA